MSGVLITGGAGYIGSHILQRLIDTSYDKSVLIWDNLSAPNSGQVQTWPGFREGNIKDTGSLTLLCKSSAVDTVIHLAAHIDVAESMLDPDKYYRVNVMYTANVVMAAARSGVKNFIFASTAAVYGPSHRSVDENDRLEPSNPYGRSKLAAEWVVQDLCRQNGMRCVILRFFNVVGADSKVRSGPMHPGSLFKVLAGVVQQPGAVITVRGTDFDTADGTAVRDYVHVEDIAAAHVTVLNQLEKNHFASGVYNLGTGSGHSVNEVIQMFEQVSGNKIPRIHGERGDGEVGHATANVNKAKYAGLLRLGRSLQEMVESSLAWERKLKEGEMVDA